jgi:hypothetical protein
MFIGPSNQRTMQGAQEIAHSPSSAWELPPNSPTKKGSTCREKEGQKQVWVSSVLPRLHREFGYASLTQIQAGDGKRHAPLSVSTIDKSDYQLLG